MQAALDAEPMMGTDRASDAQAFLARAYDEHAPYVFRALRHLGVADDDLDDAVQDVFLVLLRRLHTFEGRSSLRTWLYGVALRIARRSRESRAKKRSHESDVELAASGQSPAEATEQHLAARRIEHAMATLSEPLREVFVLIEIEELTAPEVAELLSVKLNTVYSRHRLARRGVQKALVKKRGRHV